MVQLLTTISTLILKQIHEAAKDFKNTGGTGLVLVGPDFPIHQLLKMVISKPIKIQLIWLN